MGAAQSKKKRKERKRRKRLLMGTSGFNLPRSASVDFIRTHSLFLSSCPHCQGLGSSSVDRHTISGLFHDSDKCACRDRRLRGELMDEADGYQSCPSYSNSNCCLSIANPGHSSVASSTSACWEMERSTMSLNRNLNVRSNKIVQSKSSEFTELLDILKRYEDRKRELSSIISLQPPSLTHREKKRTNLNVPSPPPTVALNDELPEPQDSSAKEISKTASKKPITLLEDDESRLARWKKQKMMAQQLRTLRKHIQLQEASQRKSHVPFLGEPTAEHGKPNSSTHPETPDSEKTLTQIVDTNQRGQRSKFSKMSNYKYLDNHPVLSRLQNEQNNRLESMERRMKEIRISAMQEAERRKFAEIFPAKQDHSQTERMMQEAKEMLEKLKEEKKKKKEGVKGAELQTDHSSTLANESRTADDSGEVIPVHVVSTSAVRPVDNTINLVEQQTILRTDGKEEKKDGENKKTDWLNNAWPNINLDQPLTWLLLPFLLFPLILRLLLNLIISTGTNTGHNTDGRNTGHRETKPKR
ncbi:hypothetical protein Btru_032980 [Bulinus truncatus]|nr:hypothetical protein Btru_032980 [Bulinus truncatus]